MSIENHNVFDPAIIESKLRYWLPFEERRRHTALAVRFMLGAQLDDDQLAQARRGYVPLALSTAQEIIKERHGENI